MNPEIAPVDAWAMIVSPTCMAIVLTDGGFLTRLDMLIISLNFAFIGYYVNRHRVRVGAGVAQ